MDDSSVSQVGQNKVLGNPNAYVLFYQITKPITEIFGFGSVKQTVKSQKESKKNNLQQNIQLQMDDLIKSQIQQLKKTEEAQDQQKAQSDIQTECNKQTLTKEEAKNGIQQDQTSQNNGNSLESNKETIVMFKKQKRLGKCLHKYKLKLRKMFKLNSDQQAQKPEQEKLALSFDSFIKEKEEVPQIGYVRDSYDWELDQGRRKKNKQKKEKRNVSGMWKVATDKILNFNQMSLCGQQQSQG